MTKNDRTPRAGGRQFSFVSYQRLTTDIIEWSRQLPTDVMAVVGIPRSGIVPAAQLALQLNVPLVPLELLLLGKRPWEHPHRRARQVKDGRILVLDDSCASGETLWEVRKLLKDRPEKFIFGAVYTRDPEANGLDVHYRIVQPPRVFQWNLFHTAASRSICCDIDGVLCAEPTALEPDRGTAKADWLQHLLSVPPRFLPTVPLFALVTSRLEKYRSVTVKWMKKHGVQYEHLIMSTHRTAAARRKAGDNAKQKAAYFMSVSSRLFVESSEVQAKKIAKISGKSVICTDTMTLYAGDEERR